MEFRPLAPGTLLQERYEIVRVVGQGGMGCVYMARDRRLRSTVALKQTFYSDERLRRAFEHEAELLANLCHPALPNVTDHFAEHNTQFIAMQFISGEDLSELLALRGTPFESRQVVAWGDQLLDALDYLHTQELPVIHRDIKPQNIKLAGRNRIVLLDFGLAKGTLPQVSRYAPNSSIFGYTPSYAPLEQIQGTGTDPRSDLYALAATLYHLLTGIAPPDAFARATAVIGGEPDPLQAADTVNPAVPQEVAAVLHEALQQNPKLRPATAALMREALLDAARHATHTGGGIAQVGASPRTIEATPDGETKLLPQTEPSPSVLPTALVAPADELQQTRLLQSDKTVQVVAAQTKADAELHTTAEVNAAGGGAQTIITRHTPTRRALFALACVILGAMIFAGVWRFASADKIISMPDAAPFREMRIARLTSSGTASRAAVSPDGKYVVYVVADRGRQSLWGKPTSATNTVQIIPPADVQYDGLSFSQDGNSVLYIATDARNPTGALYQVPALGGASRKLLDNVGTPVTLSPDGKQFAFVRVLANGKMALMVASFDGTQSRELAARNYPDFFREPAWSPDNRTIACAAGSYAGGFYMSVVGVDAATGAERPLTARKWWSVGRIAWLADGAGMIMAAREQASGTPRQIIHLSHPAGEVSRITNDLNDYSDVTLTADGRVLVTVQSNQSSGVWVAPLEGAGRSTETSIGRYDKVSRLSWTPDGRLVYTSNANGNQDVWVMNADGENVVQLTSDAGINLDPAVSPDGRYIFFGSNRTGAFNIWRMAADGSNLKRLTSGASDWWASPASDGRWVYYSSFASGKPTLWRVPVDGGTSEQLTTDEAWQPVVSPDNKFIACWYKHEGQDAGWKIAVIAAEGGKPVREFDAPSNDPQPVQWGADGRTLLYVDRRGGVSNIWSQPLAGGAPKRLTDFTGDQVFSFTLSPDGKRLAYARGTITNDVVLLRDSE